MGSKRRFQGWQEEHHIILKWKNPLRIWKCTTIIFKRNSKIFSPPSSNPAPNSWQIKMVKNLLLVGAGGMIGSICRYLMSIGLVSLNWNTPWPTMAINIIGSLIIGVLMATFEESNHAMRILLITGFCGGFTTFSAFSYENLKLLEAHQYQTAFTYSSLSVLLGLTAVFIGYFATARMIS